MLTEWKEVRIGGNCSTTLLKLQTLSNTIKAAAEGEITCHQKCTGGGRGDNKDLFNQMEYGRLILNTPIYIHARKEHVSVWARYVKVE